MAKFSVWSLVLLMVIVLLAVAEGAPKKPKKAKCKDKKKYPSCFHRQDLYCPDACPRTCLVDCATCTPVCTPPPPPPPSPPPPPPRVRRRSPPPPPPPTPPTTTTPPPPLSPTTNTPPPTTFPPPPPSSPTTFPPPPPASESAGGTRVRCKNKNYRHCYGMELSCPSGCPDHCEVDCVTCSPVCNCNRPGAVCQDPRFIGGDGITFYFHGKKDQDFCLVSDSNLHINAHFIGRRNVEMRRDFTWVQSLGILFNTHKLSIAALKTSNWDDSVDRLSLSFDEQSISLPDGEGSQWQSNAITITRSRETNSVQVEVENVFKIKARVVPITEKDSRTHNYGITQEDCFAHLDLSFKFYGLSENVNGVLGQTYARDYVSRVKMGVVMPVMGGDREFASSTLFATDCAVSRFYGHSGNSTAETSEYEDLNCASGIDGRGIVCKR
ncbi:hypothetical protein Q3G72_017449 [Acer saccharum]|nr:hypothetical protein Q3G72_017449 [Acer saccharum]